MPIKQRTPASLELYSGGQVKPNGKVVAGQATTNASGVARFYFTSDGTATGTPLLNNIYSWSADITAGVQVNSRTSALGSNFVDVTVTNLAFTGVVLLGINLLGAVTTNPVVGATVQFIVVGD